MTHLDEAALEAATKEIERMPWDVVLPRDIIEAYLKASAKAPGGDEQDINEHIESAFKLYKKNYDDALPSEWKWERHYYAFQKACVALIQAVSALPGAAKAQPAAEVVEKDCRFCGTFAVFTKGNGRVEYFDYCDSCMANMARVDYEKQAVMGEGKCTQSLSQPEDRGLAARGAEAFSNEVPASPAITGVCVTCGEPAEYICKALKTDNSGEPIDLPICRSHHIPAVIAGWKPQPMEAPIALSALPSTPAQGLVELGEDAAQRIIYNALRIHYPASSPVATAAIEVYQAIRPYLVQHTAEAPALTADAVPVDIERMARAIASIYGDPNEIAGIRKRPLWEMYREEAELVIKHLQGKGKAGE